MVSNEVACRECPLKKKCDPHLGPYVNKNGEMETVSTKFECPSYTCHDGRKDAAVAIRIKKPNAYRVNIEGTLFKIDAVPFGLGFQKFKGVIASFPNGDIFTLPPEGEGVYYPTGQSVFY